MNTSDAVRFRRILACGQDSEPPTQHELQAGPLQATLEGSTLRHIRLAGQIVIQQIYVAVRDQNWGTVEPVLSDLQITHYDRAFQVNFLARHVQDSIDYEWRGMIHGADDGTIVFQVKGEAHSDFLRNRIGFCVLHPASCAGRWCVLDLVDGTQANGHFPEHISPHQPFTGIRGITVEVAPELRISVRMEGDTFEMEDQRNWTDASFKTYCTPLYVPFPVAVRRGDRLEQTVTLSVSGPLPDVQASIPDLCITVGENESPMPLIGLGSASDGRPLSADAINQLAMLQLSHLRIDLDLAQVGYVEQLQQAASEARQLGAGLEIALWLAANPQVELEILAAQVGQIAPPVLRWLIFERQQKTSSAEQVMLARQVLTPYAPAAAFGGGTDAFFTELNRARPNTASMDFVTFSTNPQVHASDYLSLIETLPMHRTLITSARQFTGACPITVSPITFKMRWNPNATGDAPAAKPGRLPTQVDPRQMSLFGAGWTLGAISYLAEAGVASLTCFETCGWRGVLEHGEGSPLPTEFPSLPGGVFPLYHLFADLGAYVGGVLVHTQSTDPMRVVALLLKRDGVRRLLIANLTETQQVLCVSGHGISGHFRARVLDMSNVERAMHHPDAFRMESGELVTATSAGLSVVLQPFALVRLDQETL